MNLNKKLIYFHSIYLKKYSSQLLALNSNEKTKKNKPHMKSGVDDVRLN